MSQLSHDRLPFGQKFALHQWFAPAVRTFSSHFTGSPFRSSQITKPVLYLLILLFLERMSVYQVGSERHPVGRIGSGSTGY